MEHRIDETIDIDAPVGVVYNAWTQFETFPQFMEGVREVRQIDDTHLHWRVDVAGTTREWIAEIIEQVPDTRIAWATTEGKYNAGVVHFTALDGDRTRLHLRILYDADGIAEQFAEVLALTAARARRDLQTFKRHVETHLGAREGWRGSVHRREVSD